MSTTSDEEESFFRLTPKETGSLLAALLLSCLKKMEEGEKIKNQLV